MDAKKIRLKKKFEKMLKIHKEIGNNMQIIPCITILKINFLSF